MYQNSQRPQFQHQQPAPQQPHQPYTVNHDFDGVASVRATVAHALSDLTGRNVSEIEAMLSDRVDLQALDRLFSGTDCGADAATCTLTVTVEGYEMTLFGNGFISIVPVQARPPAGTGRPRA